MIDDILYVLLMTLLGLVGAVAYEWIFQFCGIEWKPEGDTLSETDLQLARDAIKILRRGWDYNLDGESIRYLEPGMRRWSSIPIKMGRIIKALESGLSHEDLGTTPAEVESFKRGSVQKTAAALHLLRYRSHPREEIRTRTIEELAEQGGFSLTSIGTSKEELLSLEREHFRLEHVEEFAQLRAWVTGGFELPLSRVLNLNSIERELEELFSGKHKTGQFSWIELEISEEEYRELMYLARRREVQEHIALLRSEAREGLLSDDFRRRTIMKLLAKGGWTLADFGLIEVDLDEIERNSKVNEARKVLATLSTPIQIPVNPELGLRSHYDAVLDPTYLAQRVRECLADAERTPADIGTNDEEINRLVLKRHREAAVCLMVMLGLADENTSLHREVSEENWRTMSDRVSSRQEPSPWLLVEGNIAVLNMHLDEARTGLEEIGGSERRMELLESMAASQNPY